jgi:quinoprotein glucose dehydrogenase
MNLIDLTLNVAAVAFLAWVAQSILRAAIVPADRGWLRGSLPVLGVLSVASFGLGQMVPNVGWDTYGGDPGGQRYSPAKQIDKSNVSRLHVAWVFHAGYVRDPEHPTFEGSFEATPILFDGSLYLATPFDRVVSLDPITGTQRWSFDARLDWGRNLGIITSRGVASWRGQPPFRGLCATRIFLGTLDGRLIALDAPTGTPCPDFGRFGTVDLTQGIGYRKGDEYAVTSPPTVLGDVVVVGSAIEDNARVDTYPGIVRGFDARSGSLLWVWDPMPWAKSQALPTGAGNTWSVIAADPEHGLIFLPTSSPSPDYYGGMRPGDNRDADSLVALDAKTGAKVWAFQAIHHNIWDYDLAAEPLLFTLHRSIPAVAIATKLGTVFVLNRLTGQPLYPVEERAVPPSDVPGEVASKTQPFSAVPPFAPITFDISQHLGDTPEDDASCRALMRGLRNDGPFTPPSLRGSILFPSNVGGVNWGATAFDPTKGTIYANVNRIPFVVTLKRQPILPPRRMLSLLKLAIGLFLLVLVLIAWRFGGRKGLILASIAALFVGGALSHWRDPLLKRLEFGGHHNSSLLAAVHFGMEYGANIGAPYVLLREPLRATSGRPCAPEPWGIVSAINLETGTAAWQTTLGTLVAGKQTGTRNVGGPIATAGGIVFSAASEQPFLRAFDSDTGKELWKGELPVPAQATPMSYVIGGKQYVVVASGGHSAFGTSQSDSVVAFSLE